jgi:hypothetical protein
MNIIKKIPVNQLGYDFITDFPKGKDEYYLRNQQNKSGAQYRRLTAHEIEVLVRNRNTSDEWGHILVSNEFNPELVKNCSFFGLIRIGNLENNCLCFSDLIVPIGIYNSTIISCDFGNNVSVHNVNYMSHYIIGNEVIINNVNELVASNHAKFGNGILKKGETASVRIWLELCNENTGRKVLPFNGMTAGDAYLWTRNRADALLQQKFIELTDNQFDTNLGYYGKVGDRTVIKNCKIIKDVLIGEDAYLKGANKIKNVTINSHPDAKTQVGEGCELVNGIIGYGCRIFYGIKAVRFVLSDYSQLKYGARLINSFLGPNATISCCEVLNSLIFPAHEQHHNNSFLCAALVMGQSNIAAGATLGSNHNSRGADGEVIMGRGFWPGLCVSIKHNSIFASFSLLNKGDYNYELNIPIPFALISNDTVKNELIIMPGYWFLYNFYALARNAWKYVDRDKRKYKTPHFEYDYLAPDTVNELMTACDIMATAIAQAQLLVDKDTSHYDPNQLLAKGNTLLSTKTKKEIDALEVTVTGFENSKRKVKLVKTYDAYHLFKELIFMYGVSSLLNHIENKKGEEIIQAIKEIKLSSINLIWSNIGGQLIPKKRIDDLLSKIKQGSIHNWDQVHSFYSTESALYLTRKDDHALACLQSITGCSLNHVTPTILTNWLNKYVSIKKEITNRIYETRAKDYSNTFRKMVYDSEAEMNAVIGTIEDNGFINAQNKAMVQLKKKIKALINELA